MKQKNIVIALIVVIVVVALSLTVIKGQSSNKGKQPAPIVDNDLIPTVDSSVVADLKGKNNNRAIDLSVKNIPTGTTSIEYSLSYQTEAQGLQGIIGTIEVQDSEKNKTLSRDLGTCSSGTCVYHKVVGNIKVELKFNGSYGERIFEKEYSL